MTPPRTPELKTSRSSTDLMYRSNYLTVPQLYNNNASGDSLYSLSDFEQVRNLNILIFSPYYFLLTLNHTKYKINLIYVNESFVKSSYLKCQLAE